jgi:conjugative relaxase-like TrwC/TraI family protein
MMTISKPKTAGGAGGYFREEYEHERGSYYTEGERVVGRWEGELATEFGLSGNVREEEFLRLAEGQDPRTGEQLVRRVRAHERENKFGEVRKTLGHRAGVDITLSAPKSVTLAAVVGGDERIREAHREANRAAMSEVERRVQARPGGSRASETTGKAVIATFEHDVARPDRKGHYAAPDLHSHNFVFNLTKTASGEARSVDMKELYRCQKLGTAVYRMRLAEGLQRLGYEVRIDERTGAPEIAGISRAYIEASSPRQSEIKETAERLRAEGKQKGMVRADGTTSTRAAATHRRRSKVFDREEMRQRHQELEAQFGGESRRAVEAARLRARTLDASLLQRDPEEGRTRAQEAVTYAVKRLSEREAVNRADALLLYALERGLGATTLEEVQAEIESRHERGELIGITDADAARQQVTTEKALQMERDNIEIMRAGQGTLPPVSAGIPERVETPQGLLLNESQRAAVEHLVTGRDRVQGLQGGAGTGKTTVLAAVKEEAERGGYVVRGFAPTTRAAQLLAESGIEAQTLQRFIRGRLEDPEAVRQLLVLDESSLASTRQLNGFLAKARPHDRVLLVGDMHQHEGVEAGSPFAQLQKHGMQTARLEKIVRQKEEPLRRVVERLAAGEVKAAVDDLRAQGRVTEIPDEQKRLRAIAKDYVERPEGTLVISPANREREELNRLIHDERRQSGQVGEAEHAARILRNRNDLTGAERTFAGAYRFGDVIRFNIGSKLFGVRVGDYARVEAVNREANLLTVEFASEREGRKSGRRMNYDPQRLQGVSVYEEAEIKVSEGERIQFRAPAQKLRVATGELGTLEKIAGERWTVRLDGGRKVSFAAGERRHVDYGYAVTSHSSQGQTVERVLVNMDTREPDVLLNHRLAYVAASRTRSDVTIYTDATDKLSAALARQVSKSTALEAVHALEAVQAPPQIAPQKEDTYGQAGRTTTQTRTDQAGASREAGATALRRTPGAFDRSRIRRPAARAVADGRAGAAVDSRSLTDGERGEGAERNGTARGTERSDRVVISGEPGRGSVAASGRTGRDAVREQHRAESRDRGAGSGHAREPAPDRREAGQLLSTAEGEHATTGGGRDGAQRHAPSHPRGEQGHVLGESRSASRLSAGVPDRQTAVTEPELSSHGAAQLPTAGGAHADVSGGDDFPAREAELRGARRAEPPAGDGGLHTDTVEDHLRHDSPAAVGDRDLHRRADALVGVAQSVDSRRDASLDSPRVRLDGRGLSNLGDGSKAGLAPRSGARGDVDLSIGDGVRRVPVVGGTGDDRDQRVGALAESSGRSRIADEVRAILDRPMQIERMAGELVQLADENRVAQGRPPISEGVQEYMRVQLVSSAGRAPSPSQVERDRQLSHSLGEPEPRHETALESSLYAARNAPDRSVLLERLTTTVEAAFEREHAPARMFEHSRAEPDYGLSR